MWMFLLNLSPGMSPAWRFSAWKPNFQTFWDVKQIYKRQTFSAITSEKESYKKRKPNMKLPDDAVRLRHMLEAAQWDLGI